jgi:hypothetical protein
MVFCLKCGDRRDVPGFLTLRRGNCGPQRLKPRLICGCCCGASELAPFPVRVWFARDPSARWRKTRAFGMTPREAGTTQGFPKWEEFLKMEHIPEMGQKPCQGGKSGQFFGSR